MHCVLWSNLASGTHQNTFWHLDYLHGVFLWDFRVPSFRLLENWVNLSTPERLAPRRMRKPLRWVALVITCSTWEWRPSRPVTGWESWWKHWEFKTKPRFASAIGWEAMVYTQFIPCVPSLCIFDVLNPISIMCTRKVLARNLHRRVSWGEHRLSRKLWERVAALPGVTVYGPSPEEDPAPWSEYSVPSLFGWGWRYIC